MSDAIRHYDCTSVRHYDCKGGGDEAKRGNAMVQSTTRY